MVSRTSLPSRRASLVILSEAKDLPARDLLFLEK